ncbi:conserved protein of unknown function [Bradyrhizobium sp. ORS 285]|uniref:hypothetical protein n=1 Tax=Bradyrhizobium sp. ORS 285 TaxID=115808 RepID=UPI0002407391|nr:hypothetical protein [Bradyrhizobium sp. ORS 285]CCD89001.1 conserved hypothetical protein [Bradyrhizobium sp. ORS 285]SMX58337.1 conserved protein of unknown function [Bradyrhizobium sp. ORS 285]
MALHRDIFWIGRQWAVTGSGIQAVDQRLKGAFDVDRTAVWDDGLAEALSPQPWFNAADFEKALDVARARFPAQPRPEAAAPPAAAPNVPEASSVSAVPLRLGAGGKLARFLPQWRVRS